MCIACVCVIKQIFVFSGKVFWPCLTLHEFALGFRTKDGIFLVLCPIFPPFFFSPLFFFADFFFRDAMFWSGAGLSKENNDKQ